MADVLIMTPGVRFTNRYVLSLASTIKAFQSQGITWELINANSSNIFASREHTLDRVSNHYDSEVVEISCDYNKMIWIDSDISWTPEDILKIYRHDLDIVTGVYYMDQSSPAIYETKWLPANKDDLYKEPLKKIAGCGFGFLAVKKGVFESLTKPVFTPTTPGLGEDLAWCEKASEAGYDLWVDTTINLGHSKQVVFGKDGFSVL